jgi:hypothetical protein
MRDVQILAELLLIKQLLSGEFAPTLIISIERALVKLRL